MKLLFDQNLSPKLATYFSTNFENCHHVQDIGFGEVEDMSVWEYAKTNEYTIVSKDSDFNNFLLWFSSKSYLVEKGKLFYQSHNSNYYRKP